MIEHADSEKDLDKINSYLQSEWHYEIYQQLSDTELFEPLEFFQMLYSFSHFIRENKAKPLLITQKIKEMNLTEQQLDFFYYRINEFWGDEKNGDTQLMLCFRELSRLAKKDRNSLMKLYAEAFVSTHESIDFNRVLKHLETLETYNDKINYLIEEKTTYLQNRPVDYAPTKFDKKCDLEIQKLEKLQEINPDSNRKHKDLTLDRAIFLLTRLIPFTSASSNTAKGKLLSFLTGYNAEQARQRFSNIDQKDAENAKAFKDDMKIVIEYLEILGLKDKVKEIKKDLDFE